MVFLDHFGLLPILGDDLEVFFKEKLDEKSYSYNKIIVNLYELLIFVGKEYSYFKNRIEDLQSEIIVKESMNF